MPATTAPKNSQPLSCLSRLRQPQDAAEHYHHAWDLVQGASAQSGYRLALNYMKAGQAVKAILESAGLERIELSKDADGHDRVVSGRRPG